MSPTDVAVAVAVVVVVVVKHKSMPCAPLPISSLSLATPTAAAATSSCAYVRAPRPCARHKGDTLVPVSIFGICVCVCACLPFLSVSAAARRDGPTRLTHTPGSQQAAYAYRAAPRCACSCCLPC